MLTARSSTQQPLRIADLRDSDPLRRDEEGRHPDNDHGGQRRRRGSARVAEQVVRYPDHDDADPAGGNRRPQRPGEGLEHGVEAEQTVAAPEDQMAADGTDDVVLELDDDDPGGLGWLPDGDLLVVGMEHAKLWRWDGSSLSLHADLRPYAAWPCNDMTVAVDGTAEVAGRAAYQLVLTPLPTERTLLREVRVAVDAETRQPLQLTVLAQGSGEPALQVGFSETTARRQVSDHWR